MKPEARSETLRERLGREGLTPARSSVIQWCMSKSEGPVSIRLDAETEQRLRRLAHETGGTMSSVVREAVTAYGAAWDSQEAASSVPFTRLQHLIGVVSSRTDRSERTGETFHAALQARQRARRSR